MAKEQYEHKDRLGRMLKVGDCVAVPHHNGLLIGTVKKLNAKMINVAEIGKATKNWKGKTRIYHKYSSEAVLLDGPEVTMYLLSVNTES